MQSKQALSFLGNFLQLTCVSAVGKARGWREPQAEFTAAFNNPCSQISYTTVPLERWHGLFQAQSSFSDDEKTSPLDFVHVLVERTPMPWPFWLRTGLDQEWAGRFHQGHRCLYLMTVTEALTSVSSCGLPCIHQLRVKGLQLQTFFLLKTLKAKFCFPECFFVLLRINYAIILSVYFDPSN